MNKTVRVLIRVLAIVLASPIALFSLLATIAAVSSGGDPRTAAFAAGAALLAAGIVAGGFVTTRTRTAREEPVSR